MKKISRSLIASAALGLVAVPAAALAQQQPTPPEAGTQPRMGAPDRTPKTGEPVPLDQVPEPARKAIEGQTKGGRIDRVEKITTADGKTQYRAYVERGGQKRDVLVAADGKVLRPLDESRD